MLENTLTSAGGMNNPAPRVLLIDTWYILAFTLEVKRFIIDHARQQSTKFM